MFENALNSSILIGVLIGEFGRMCNLHYADDLLILTTGGAEDLRVIKLILMVFEGLSGSGNQLYQDMFILYKFKPDSC